jgi:hypothetical protein
MERIIVLRRSLDQRAHHVKAPLERNSCCGLSIRLHACPEEGDDLKKEIGGGVLRRSGVYADA